MNLSGILVIVAQEHFTTAIRTLNTLPGVEVHHSDEATGRIILVQEAENVGAEVEGLKRIKALPHISLAEMVYHYIEEDNQKLDDLQDDIDQLSASQPAVPAYLNNDLISPRHRSH
ncbi:MAG TPA: nitrate reductase formation protein NapD [Gammaproteobacteria bacterium]|nr:nitrate reductase formation protein NapD [Gammaproteobacteria bacterium]